MLSGSAEVSNRTKIPQSGAHHIKVGRYKRRDALVCRNKDKPHTRSKVNSGQFPIDSESSTTSVRHKSSKNRCSSSNAVQVSPSREKLQHIYVRFVRASPAQSIPSQTMSCRPNPSSIMIKCLPGCAVPVCPVASKSVKAGARYSISPRTSKVDRCQSSLIHNMASKCLIRVQTQSTIYPISRQPKSLDNHIRCNSDVLPDEIQSYQRQRNHIQSSSSPSPARLSQVSPRPANKVGCLLSYMYSVNVV